MSNANVYVKILQDNLNDLRKIAGWTAETLASKLDITKQTISNLETHKVKMSFIQYIAIRSVLECETTNNPNNPSLRKIYSTLFNLPPSVYMEKENEIRIAMVSISSIAAAGISGTNLYASTIALLAPLKLPNVSFDISSANQPNLIWLQRHLISINTEEAITDNEGS